MKKLYRYIPVVLIVATAIACALFTAENTAAEAACTVAVRTGKSAVYAYLFDTGVIFLFYIFVISAV